MRYLPPVLLVLAMLAGCSDAPTAPAQVLIESSPPEEVRSNESVPAVVTPSPKSRGHLAGVVVDEAIRPIVNATVRLPGMDLERQTERDGSFGFVDLYPGPYYVTVEMEGYYAAEAMLEVKAEEFTRAKVVLTAVPPPDPYHVTQAFEGYTELTEVPTGLLFTLGLVCNACSFEAYVEPQGLRAVVLEAFMDGGTTSNGFYFQVDAGSYWASGEDGYPLYFMRKSEEMDPTAERFDLYVEPTSFPAPETGKRFQVYLTAFYNEDPPLGWSIATG